MIKKLLLVLALSTVVLGSAGCMSTPEAGEIGVVRNGKAWYNPFDWFDNRNIRGYVDNGAGNSWTGMGSNVHYYPVDSQQRFFKMETCANGRCKGADAQAPIVPTSDGVEAQIHGTFYLNTSFNNSKEGQKALAAFDQQFATRQFDGKHAYDGTGGWSAFLGAIIEPIVVNNLREVVSGVRCAELVSSCALVQNQGDRKVSAKELADQNNQSNVRRIQTAVEQGLAADLRSTIGGQAGQEFFKNIKFNLKVVRLPREIQHNINRAQSEFAKISQAQARVEQEEKNAEANRKKQTGYESCPACARIDALKAIPPTITTYAPGGDFAVTK